MHIVRADLSDALAPRTYSLTAAQQDIWIGQILDPDRYFYNIGMAAECIGAIDPDLLDKAVRYVIGEVDAHCLNFVDTKNGSRQYLRRLPNLNIPRLDFSREHSPKAAALAWMRANRNCPVLC
jgi:hypothetical protein